MIENTSQIKQGFLYRVDAEPHSGREAGGHNSRKVPIRRPVVVVSNDHYNQTGMALVFALTSNQRKSRYLSPTEAQLRKPSQIILTQVFGYDMLSCHAKPMNCKISDRQLEYLRSVVSHII